MADLTNMAISSKAMSCADSLMECGYFQHKSDLLLFAAAYMIKHHLGDFCPASYIPEDSSGTNYAFSTFDSDGKLSSMIRALYENCSTPYLFLRSLMDKGLIEMKERMDKDPSFDLFSEITS